MTRIVTTIAATSAVPFAADSFFLRACEPKDRIAVAQLLHQSIAAGRPRPGQPPCAPEDLAAIPDFHERLAGNDSLVAISAQGTTPIGTCFVRRHGAHADIGPLAVHPSYRGRGVAAALLTHAVGTAERNGAETATLLTEAGHPNLVAMSDRLGFSPRQVLFAFDLAVPPEGLAGAADIARVRPAAVSDIEAMAGLESRMSGVTRFDEHALALTDASGAFRVVVVEGQAGALAGFAVAAQGAAFGAIGPCVAENEETAAALIACAADQFRGRSVRLLAPTAARGLIALLYAWGARLDEVLLLQGRGVLPPQAGLVMPGMPFGGG